MICCVNSVAFGVVSACCGAEIAAVLDVYKKTDVSNSKLGKLCRKHKFACKRAARYDIHFGSLTDARRYRVQALVVVTTIATPRTSILAH